MALVLPQEYVKETILELYISFFPNHWEKLKSKYTNFLEKDQFLLKVGKKARYNHKKPHSFFYSLPKVKLMLSDGYKKKHYEQFEEGKLITAINNLKSKSKKIKKVSSEIQSVDPVFLDYFIYSYHKVGASLGDKLEILNELKKYRTNKVVTFFQKINEAEKNNQLRDIAFIHLQSLNVYVKKRSKFKGKIKSYQTQTFSFDGTPESLFNKIKEKEIQSRKEYEIFISHSYLDNKLVIEIKNELNRHGFNIYCDWTSDSDFLKRELAGSYTELVLKHRVSSSQKILFIQTENSIKSDGGFSSEWVRMEIDYANEIGKEICCINFTDYQPISRAMINMKYDVPFTLAPAEMSTLNLVKGKKYLLTEQNE